MTDKKTIRVLLVEDNETHSHLVRRHLQKAKLSTFEVALVETLSGAIATAQQGQFDAVLLDLSLPDSEITETLGRFIEAVPELPTVVLTSLSDLDFASELVHQGADDFLVKSDIGSQILLRSIRYAIQRRRNRQELADYARRLKRSNDELKSFAHTIGHEVRSRLNIVSCCLTLIREDYGEQLDEDSREAISDADTAIRDMTELVTDLLDYSRVEHDRGNFDSVDMLTLAQDALSSLKAELERTAAKVNCDSLPTICCNAVQIRQVLRNLFGNAIKYRDPGRCPVVHLSCQELAGEWLFCVQDNGLGVPECSLKQVFDPFVRVHESTGISGTGIGLSFCQRIIDNHDGKIWVQPNADHGSTFCFTIAKTQS